MCKQFNLYAHTFAAIRLHLSQKNNPLLNYQQVMWHLIGRVVFIVFEYDMFLCHEALKRQTHNVRGAVSFHPQRMKIYPFPEMCETWVGIKKNWKHAQFFLCFYCTKNDFQSIVVKFWDSIIKEYYEIFCDWYLINALTYYLRFHIYNYMMIIYLNITISIN